MSAVAERHGAALQKASVGGYELKNVRGHNTLDGYAWTATIYRDGKKVGFAEQSGTGGMTMTHFVSNDERVEFDRYAREDWNVTRQTVFYGTAVEMVEDDAEGFAEALMSEYEIGKRLRADIRKGKLPIVFAADLADAFAEHDLLSAWRSITGGANNLPGVIAHLAKDGRDKGALRFDGTTWVPLES